MLSALAFACGPESEPPRVPESAPSRPTAILPPIDTVDASARPTIDAEPGSDAAPPPRRRDRLTHFPTPSFGAGDVSPAATHPFRMVVSTKAMRASKSAARLGRALSLLPAMIDAKQRTGVDVLADSEWLLAYGPNLGALVTNANVVRHHVKDDDVTQALGKSGFEASRFADGGLASDLFGTDTVLLRPRAQTIAFVPQDRARDFGAALAKLDDPGIRAPEILTLAVRDPKSTVPGKVGSLVPAELTKVEGTMKPGPGDSLDLAAEGTCTTPEACKEAAATMDATVKAQNSMMVRIATRGLLSSFAVRAEGAKVKATLHVSAEQVEAIDQLMRSLLGLPAVDPVAPP